MHRTLRFLLAAPLLASAPLTAAAQAPAAPAAPAASRDLLPLPATERTLANGLRVIVVPTGFPNIVSLQIPVQTGSRNEIEPGKSGFAHFFEHMMFRGTEQYPPDDYNQILTRAGARQNAYTSDDLTNYHITFAKEDLDIMLKIEADRFQNLKYSEDVFKTEARAVLGEYNKNSAAPTQKLFEAIRKAAFSTHTYGHTTMGFIEDIEDMPNQFEYSKIFFDRWYRPEYTTIIVAGDVTADEVMPLVEKYWGGWQRGSYTADIPREPDPTGPKYTHVPWTSTTLPLLRVGFRGPGFSTINRDQVALSMLSQLYFGQTSELYRKLVQQEQKVDQLGGGLALSIDPNLFSIFARVKKLDDAVYVRDEILHTIARSRSELVDSKLLADAKSNLRYSFVRSMDNTESIASTLARFAHYERSFATLNQVYALFDALTPEDLREAARRYFTDAGMVVATLSREQMPPAMATLPAIGSFAAAASDGAAGASSGVSGAGNSAGAASMAAVPRISAGRPLADVEIVRLQSPLPQLNVKLLFTVGSSDDPAGKEGLAALSAAMVADAGSRQHTTTEITRALYPMAGGFFGQVDKEMTTFTASVHRENWERYADIALRQLTEPGFREEDFSRLKARQLNALTSDLRSNNEEELGKERLQVNVFQGTPYGHPVLGTVAGVQAITLDDVRNFVASAYTQGNVHVAIGGDAPDVVVTDIRAVVGSLPAGAADTPAEVAGRKSQGREVEIIKKDTRATAISFGHPIAVTRSHPDFPALWLARAWLGEHRSMLSHLYQRIREVRGMNYGNYAYIEAFPGGMFQFFPSPNIARRAQLFEIWIRPVPPEQAHMALRIAVHELENLVANGLTQQQFDDTRDYLMKNVFVMTSTQNQQVGYALDSQWYGIGEFTSYMRDHISKLTLEDVNRAIRTHLDPQNLSIVMITDDAESLRQALVSDAPSPIKYDSPKPPEIVEEDKVLMVKPLGITAAKVKITPVTEVFAQ
ncbi:MAG TPA: pitrilysin family protein [Gemmatimonadaceae bacterium]|nr:pitrilysin family protein [Gemmatimonadaceae bacterium]